VYVAIVVRSHPTQGVLEVKIQNGEELSELHDVQVISIANNNILQYSSADSLWHNVAGTTTNIAEGTNLYYTDTRARASISTTATGLTYTSGTGVLSLTAGYVIPTTTSATEWDTAYTNRITSATSPLSITSNVISIAQATTSTNGYLSSTDWTTFNNKQATLSLTTTGSSGAATLVSNTLNIPTYTLTGLGGVPTTRTLTINGTGYDLSADRSWTIPTSVNATFTQDYTATAAQTTFTVTGGYTVGQLAVYYNGSKLASAEFTATNGTTFVLATACQVNDIVQAVVEITGGGIGGSGTTNYVSKFTASGVIGNSLVYESGNMLGVNTTTLDSSGGIYTGITIDSSTYTRYSLQSSGVAKGRFQYDAANVSLGSQATGGKLQLFTSAAYAMEFLTNDTLRMTISSAGNVGIGGTPTTKFELFGSSGNFQIASSGAEVFFTRNDNNDFLANAGSSAGIRFGAQQQLRFATGTSLTTRITITTGGDVLIGTTTTSLANAGTQLVPNGETYHSIINSLNTLHVYDRTNSVYRFYVGGNGTVNATNTTISAISDVRLKENIVDLEIGLDAIMSLRPRQFDWKKESGNSGKNVRGFIAQEFEQIFPDLIDESINPSPEGEEPYKQIRQDLIPILVKAIQEQQALITSLQEQINQIKNK
jgi:hypothetical protein